MVTGGFDHYDTFAEVLFTNGTSMCELPPTILELYDHTQSGLTTCGGSGFYGSYHTERRCMKFENGSWTKLTDNLMEERTWHTSWVTPNGDILLIGGYGYEVRTTTEIVYQNGTSIRSFDLKHDTV